MKTTPLPVIIDGKPLFAFCSTWTENNEIKTSFGCMTADSLAEAAAEGLAAGKKDFPKAQYVSHGAHQVIF